MIVAVWSVSYLALGLLWALGGPGYPFDAGRAGPDSTLLDPLPEAAGGAALAMSALVAGVVAVLAARGPLNRAAAVVAGFGLAVILPDVRVMMTAGYLPVMLAAALARQVEFSLIATMLTWPSVNLLILMVAGVSVMGRRPLGERANGLRLGKGKRRRFCSARSRQSSNAPSTYGEAWPHPCRRVQRSIGPPPSRLRLASRCGGRCSVSA
ncbi:hypothetical protein AB0L44_46975 [Nonomuraea wenchangensis]|uniref:hypothetical protein n=1 Tax=Nonomuraea wenchangensis TaxID=568860 RepID=UPI00341582CC